MIEPAHRMAMWHHSRIERLHLADLRAKAAAGAFRFVVTCDRCGKQSFAETAGLAIKIKEDHQTHMIAVYETLQVYSYNDALDEMWYMRALRR